MSKAERIIQMGVQVTEGLGAGSQPEVGRAAAEEVIDEIRDHSQGATWCSSPPAWAAAPAPARRRSSRASRASWHPHGRRGHQAVPLRGQRRMRIAETGISELQKCVDTLIVIPNQNLFRVANEKTTFADAFAMADQVLYSGVACITDLMVKEGLINLDFADVRAVMREMGKAMMGTGEASGEKRALARPRAAIANPLIDDASMKGAKGLLISITGGRDLTLYEVDDGRDPHSRRGGPGRQHHRHGATYDENLEGIIRVSVVATGIDQSVAAPRNQSGADSRLAELAQKLRPGSAAGWPSGFERAEDPRPHGHASGATSIGVPAPSTDAIESGCQGRLWQPPCCRSAALEDVYDPAHGSQAADAAGARH
jgi:cell division protein FtsZ